MKKGLLQVTIANFITLFISILISFFLPRNTSIDTYAKIKTFNLYLSYARFLHLGYCEGLYIKYGGKDFKDIGKSTLSSEMISLLLFQLIWSCLFFVIGLRVRDGVILLFGCALTVHNLANMYKNVYQAAGRFSRYAIAINIEKAVMLIGYLLLIFVLKSDNYIYFIVVGIFNVMLCLIYLLYDAYMEKKLDFPAKISIRLLYENIKSGFFLLIGDQVSILFTGMDRWFIKLLLTTSDFAKYSFAVSCENLISVTITPITMTLYNYLCRVEDKMQIIRLKKMLLVFSLCFLSCTFPLKWIVIRFIPLYGDSVSCMVILIACQVFYVLIKGVSINVYKANKQQKRYLLIMLAVIGIAFIYNVILYILMKNREAMAVGTFMAAVTWFVICEIDQKDNRLRLKEYIAMQAALAIYLIVSFKIESVILGLFIYVLCVGVIIRCCFKKEFLYILSIIRELIDSFMKRKCVR